ncbi:MAG: TrbC/VirB2 family protein [Succinivibrionaceae bacterium]|nr:TrbC/VirB2 family protein [Succinivibrionaceae bacterium]
MKFIQYLKQNSLKIVTLLAIAVVALIPDVALATSTMPYDSALTNLKNSLTGPVAQAIAVIGIVASGATLIFGGEISGFLKSVIYLILVCSLLIAGTKFIDVFGSSSSGTGAEVAQVYVVDSTHQYVIS